MAQVTGQSITNLRRTIPDAPGRVDSDPARTCVFSTALDRQLTDSPTRLNLVMLLFDAYQDGTHRHQLSTRYKLDRRIALQHQHPGGPMRHTHNLITLLAAIDPVDLHDMLTPFVPALPP
ncbi:hypothetical protein ABZ366_03645 [Streptomyces sp. NPDC005904]|uniref:hypothetical protein n=1 Tax=Streptomyces sp. NPDC005904 TaxID=3154570 RepID=UPI0033C982F2